ncbi:hypothetical protein [Morganella morganii]|uniref:hypothetical protein n=1 Tax=Morganella morganii TaxID=582 RepID=UPI0030BFFDD4
MSETTYKAASWGEVKADVYSGESCNEHRPFIEMLCDGDMESCIEDEVTFRASRWPVGTKITVEVPCCPTCGLDAEYQDKAGRCECGFDWKEWAENKYS